MNLKQNALLKVQGEFRGAGNSVKSLGLASPRGLARENRSKGRVFCDSNLEEPQEIPPICMKGHSDGICLPPLRAGSGPTVVHQNHETGGGTLTQVRHSLDNLFRRPLVHEFAGRGSQTGHGHSPIFARELRVRNKFREVTLHTFSKSGVPGLCGQHPRDDSASSGLQGSR